MPRQLARLTPPSGQQNVSLAGGHRGGPLRRRWSPPCRRRAVGKSGCGASGSGPDRSCAGPMSPRRTRTKLAPSATGSSQPWSKAHSAAPWSSVVATPKSHDLVPHGGVPGPRRVAVQPEARDGPPPGRVPASPSACHPGSRPGPAPCRPPHLGPAASRQASVSLAGIVVSPAAAAFVHHHAGRAWELTELPEASYALAVQVCAFH